MRPQFFLRLNSYAIFFALICTKLEFVRNKNKNRKCRHIYIFIASHKQKTNYKENEKFCKKNKCNGSIKADNERTIMSISSNFTIVELLTVAI